MRVLTGLFIMLLVACDGPRRPHEWVNPWIGTDGHGHTYPGATRPFGLVQLSPDTRVEGWDACAGYHYSDQTIMGFSHTHLSGTGIADLGDILLMPFTGDIQLTPGTERDPDSGYRSRFRHEDESAHAGYYAVELLDDKIDVRLTTTARCGFHQYIYKSEKNGRLLLDLKHGIGPDRVRDAQLRIVDDYEIEGFRRSRGWATDQHVYFVIRFSEPVVTARLFRSDSLQLMRNIAGAHLKAVFDFDLPDNRQLEVRVGISAVDIEGARRNLNAELPSIQTFDMVLDESRRIWDQALNKIQVEGSDAVKTKYATALYRTMIVPNIYEDIDKRYRGIDGQIRTADGFTNYSVFSLWDTFRATHPLYNIIERERNTDFIKTLLAKYVEGGRLPIWELNANYTGTMIGNHGISVIIDAMTKGVTDFDHQLAFEAMKHSADQTHLGLGAYQQLGFVPADVEESSVSKTLEYANNDWMIWRMSQLLNEPDSRFQVRAGFYQNLYDPKTKFMRPKRNGAFVKPFDPFEVTGDYTEANAWQYTYFVPHDVGGLIRLMGGKTAFEARLDSLFSAKSDLSGWEQPDITGLIGQYAHGNEPSHNFAYLYNFAERPDKTQRIVRKIMREFYTTEADGIIGNEDCGQMSAWYNFSALGFYPFNPGTPAYLIGSPEVESAIIQLPGNKTLSIQVKNQSETNIYVKSVTLNGSPLTNWVMSHSQLMAGGELIYEMSSDPPVTEWSANGLIRIFTMDRRNPAVPMFEYPSQTFIGSTTVKLKSLTRGQTIEYQILLPGNQRPSPIYTYDKPIQVNRGMQIIARTSQPFFSGMAQPTNGAASMNYTGGGMSPSVPAMFIEIPEGFSVSYDSLYSHIYTGGGEHGLIDFIRGGTNFKSGWQGFQGHDMIATVDFGRTVDLDEIGAGFLQNIRSWIFFPESVEFYAASDGMDFKFIGRETNRYDYQTVANRRHDFRTTTRIRARYLKIVAKNIKTCPAWHPGAGGKAWIFCDEIFFRIRGNRATDQRMEMNRYDATPNLPQPRRERYQNPKSIGF